MVRYFCSTNDMPIHRTGRRFQNGWETVSGSQTNTRLLISNSELSSKKWSTEAWNLKLSNLSNSEWNLTMQKAQKMKEYFPSKSTLKANLLDLLIMLDSLTGKGKRHKENLEVGWLMDSETKAIAMTMDLKRNKKHIMVVTKNRRLYKDKFLSHPNWKMTNHNKMSNSSCSETSSLKEVKWLLQTWSKEWAKSCHKLSTKKEHLVNSLIYRQLAGGQLHHNKLNPAVRIVLINSSSVETEWNINK